MKITRTVRNTLVALVVCTTFAARAQATFPVIDVAAIALAAEEIIYQAQQAASLIQQIQNQVQSLQNQARMLEDLGFSNYQEALDSMRRIQGVLRQNCASIGAVPGRIGYTTGFDCDALMDRFRRTYPPTNDWATQSDQQIARYPEERNTQKRDAAIKAMQTQNASVEAMTGTNRRMEQLADASQNAEGQKAAVQVTNQMLVTLSAQLRDQQATAVADQRAAAIEKAEEAAWHERNKEVVRRLTRDSNATYTVNRVRTPFHP